jgi:hypothetical protein
MSNYPEHHGKYERTELVRTRISLSFAKTRVARLQAQALEAAREVGTMEQRIAELEKAEAK